MEFCAALSHLPLRHRIPPLLHGHPELRSTPGAATQGGFGPEFSGPGILQGLDALVWLLVIQHICRAAHHLSVPHPALSKAFPNICLFAPQGFQEDQPQQQGESVPSPLVCPAQGLGCAGSAHRIQAGSALPSKSD